MVPSLLRPPLPLGGILYTTARREGYNVLALGQHLDDLAESFVMSAFHNGRLRTMKASGASQPGQGTSTSSSGVTLLLARICRIAALHVSGG